MSDQIQRTAIERAIARALRNRRLTRRQFLVGSGRGALVSGAALSLPAILAACGIRPGASPSPAASAARSLPAEPAGELNFANWALYIDVSEEDESVSPTLQQFTEATDIQVNYQEAIEDNESFYGTIQPVLAEGQDTGWDLMVLTDWLIGKMANLGYLEPLHHDRIANFAANAADKYKNPTYDPNNAHSVPWQSGITGIAYNPELTGREITSLEGLFDPAFEGRIGMFTEMRDTMSLALLSIGVLPHEATIEDAQRAQERLLEQAPLVRSYYGNEYADELAAGNLAITMAWSGDVFQLQFDNPDLQFVVPDEGGVLWVDNMCIPRNAQHPVDAHELMNFVYQPEIAAQIAEYVNYICPVPAAQEIIRQHAQEAADGGDQETADYLNSVAESPMVFPTEEMLERLYSYRVLTEEEEEQWNELFNEVVSG